MMRLLYSIVWLIILPFVLLRLLIKAKANRAYLHNIGQRFSILKATNFSSERHKIYWFHAVSVGEVGVAMPIIQAIKDHDESARFIATTMTPTGKENLLRQAKSRQLQDVIEHRYIPYDLSFFINRFINIIQPKKLIVLETEIWPNLYHCVNRAGIDIILANMRLSKKSFEGYQKIKKFILPTLQNVKYFLTQSEFDAEYLIALGVDQGSVKVVGNIKFDQSISTRHFDQAEQLKKRLGNRKIWVAGSTHLGEDEPILCAHKALLHVQSDALLIIVPRHPERFNNVAKQIAEHKLKFTRLSNIDSSQDEELTQSQVLLGDTMGDLLSLYALSDFAYVGGTLVKVGGHNVLEPLFTNTPVVYGPYMFKNKAIDEALQRQMAAYKIDDEKQLKDLIVSWGEDKEDIKRTLAQAKDVIAQNQGATLRCADIIRLV